MATETQLRESQTQKGVAAAKMERLQEVNAGLQAELVSTKAELAAQTASTAEDKEECGAKLRQRLERQIEQVGTLVAPFNHGSLAVANTCWLARSADGCGNRPARFDRWQG